MKRPLNRVLNSLKGDAKQLIGDPKLLAKLLGNAGTKASKNKSTLSKAWDELQLLFRLLKSYVSGEYREISSGSLIFAVCVVIYFVNPIDLIPDFLIGGFVDDMTLLAMVVKSLRNELEEFEKWEMLNKP